MSPIDPQRCVVLGGGGHAYVLLDCLVAADEATPVAILDSNPDLWGTRILGVPILGGEDRLPLLINEGIAYFIVGLGSTGDSAGREKLFTQGLAQGLEPLAAIHPSAVLACEVHVDMGSMIFARAVLNPGVRVGKNVIINTGAVVEHDVWIGDHAHVAPGAVVCGDVHIGSGAHVGAGSVIRQGCRIGEGALIGAGAAVVKDVPARSTVAGVPAKALRRARQAETAVV